MRAKREGVCGGKAKENTVPWLVPLTLAGWLLAEGTAGQGCSSCWVNNPISLQKR